MPEGDFKDIGSFFAALRSRAEISVTLKPVESKAERDHRPSREAC